MVVVVHDYHASSLQGSPAALRRGVQSDPARSSTTRVKKGESPLGRGLLALAHNGNAGAIDAIQEIGRSASKRDYVLLAPTLKVFREHLHKASRL